MDNAKHKESHSRQQQEGQSPQNQKEVTTSESRNSEIIYSESRNSSSSSSSISGVTGSSTDANPKTRRNSNASSLKSKTFDLREFTGMESDRASSSPSLADTIIARGVEYKPHKKSRYAEMKQQSSDNAVQPTPTRSKNSENFLQPEEFLNVDPRHFVKRPMAGRERRERDRFVLDHFDEDRISVVNYRIPHGKPSPDYSMRMENKFSPVDYFDPNQSNNSLRSTVEMEQQRRTWKENESNNYNNYHDDRSHRNGWHHPNREGPPEKRVQKPKDPPLSFVQVLIKSLFGSAPLIAKQLGERQHLWYWWPCIFLESFFRSIGAVSLAPNPLSGFIVFLTMLIVTPIATLIGTLALITSILTAIFFMEIPLETVRSGGVGFNGFLVGIVIGDMSDVSYFSLYVVVILAGIVIIFVYCGMDGWAKNTSLPLLNAPFNLVYFLYFASGLALILKMNEATTHNVGKDVGNVSYLYSANISRLFGQEYTADEVDADDPLNWIKVLKGIVIAPSQFYLTNTISSSVMVILSWFIFSPTLAIQSLVGSTIGSLIGTVLADPPYTHLYNGGWSYNSLFTCSAIGGVFYLLNIKSWLLSVVGAMLAAMVYAVFLQAKLPIGGIPFMLVTWLCLSMSYLDEHKKKPIQGRNMYRWFALFKIPNDQIDTPEAHFHLYCNNMKNIRQTRVLPKNVEANDVPASELHL